MLTTIGDRAQRTRLPEGTVRLSLQRLLSSWLVRYDGERSHFRNETDADGASSTRPRGMLARVVDAGGVFLHTGGTSWPLHKSTSSRA